MIRAATGLSEAASAPAAAAQACEAALAGLGGTPASALLILGTTAHARGLEDAVRAIEKVAGPTPWVGGLSRSVLAGGLEVVGSPAFGVLALGGVEAHAFATPDLGSVAAGDEITHVLAREPASDDLLCLLFDAGGSDLAGVVSRMPIVTGPSVVVGAGLADAGDGAARTFANGELQRGGVAGIWVRGGGAPRVGATFSCRPSAGPYVVTRSEGHWILALDERPALDVFREVARGPLAQDLGRAIGFVLATLPQDGGEACRMRHLVGISEERRGFALPEIVPRGQRIGFAFRDAGPARDDLRALLADFAAPLPAFGLYLGCEERGPALFGVDGLEAAYIAAGLPEVPVLGLSGSSQIGPIGGRTTLLTHAAVLASLPR